MPSQERRAISHQGELAYARGRARPGRERTRGHVAHRDDAFWIGRIGSEIDEDLRREVSARESHGGEGRIRGVLTIDAIGKALRPVAPGSADTSL